MLASDKNTAFIIYPPGIEFSYRWNELGELLFNPNVITRLDPNLATFDWEAFGYSKDIKPCKLLDGPDGGGIIIVELARTEKWIPWILLASEANTLPPAAMIPVLERFLFQVVVLEPRNELGKPQIKGSSQFRMCEGATAEHLPEAKGNVYWLVTIEDEELEEAVSNTLISTAAGFKVDAERMDVLPKAAETYSALLRRIGRGAPHSVAYRLLHHPDGAGLTFAIMLYTGLVLTRQYQSRFRTIHLLASIEGAPTVWK